MLLLVAAGSMCHAQKVEGRPANPVPFTLRVYTNTIQVPVLVLDWLKEPMAPVAGSRFGVSVDGGPEFRPTHVRLEADDPISLAVVLDPDGTQKDLMSEAGEALAGLAPAWLHGPDRVSIYGLDCELMLTLQQVRADPAVLRAGMDRALQKWRNREAERPRPSCHEKLPLWDSLMVATLDLEKQPGRRVILVITDGRDKGSKTAARDLALRAQQNAVAVFAFKEDAPVLAGKRVEDELNAVCELSGGVVMHASKKKLDLEFQHFVETVRGRYIVEFPRPARATAGAHELAVTIGRSNAFIRPAGIAVPLPDPKVLADPTTVVPTLAGETPVEGTRKIMRHGP